jgi:UDP-N-acetylmuramyl tripeptide synthase
METTTVANKKTVRRKKKLTPEENRVLNAAMPSGNKYTEAARKHQGSFIVYDPHFML